MDAGPKQDLWNLLPVIIVLLLGAAYFAIMETAFSSASRIRLKAAADHGNRRAGQALYVLDHFDQAITTLLIGTNILHRTIATIVTVAGQRVWGSGCRRGYLRGRMATMRVPPVYPESMYISPCRWVTIRRQR